MSAVVTSPRRTDWLTRTWAAPSWLLSLLIHAALLAVFIVWSERWQPLQPAGFGDEPSREVGIVLGGPPGQALEIVKDQAANAVEPTVDVAPPADAAVTPTKPLALPSSLQELTAATAPTTASAPSLPAIGAGTPRPTSGDARDLIKGAIGAQKTAALGAAIPGAAFLGAKDQGTRVVFVVDCSASMADDNAMRTAKAALVSSLQALTEAQQFQIVFYNQSPTLLKLRTQKPAEMPFATEVNKTLARQHIAGIEPELGTDHLPALRLALRLNPDVLFFLTDADEPQLSAGELNEIKRLNQGHTRIHTIEFARGSELGDTVNFLKKLAAQNGGTYRYHDVRRLGQPR